MRCQSCDCNLNDDESVRKDPITKNYLDLCDDCYYDNDGSVAFEEPDDDDEDSEDQV